jgi:hypothetical protein
MACPWFPVLTKISSCSHTISKVFAYAVPILPRVYKMGPAWFRRFAVNLFPSPVVHELRDMIDLMHSTSVEIYNAKKKALEEGGDAMKQQVAQGKDVISVLSGWHLVSLCLNRLMTNFIVRENMKEMGEDRPSESNVIAQMSYVRAAFMVF